MEEHEWILAVLVDLERFARKNQLETLEAKVNRARGIAALEIGQFSQLTNACEEICKVNQSSFET